MRNSFWSLVGIVAAALALSPGLSAQVVQVEEMLDKEGPGGPAPVHDLLGSWAGKRGANSKPAPYTPAGLAAFKLNKPGTSMSGTNDPWMVCDPFGFPRSLTQETNGMTFSQTSDRIIISYMYNRTARIVWMDGRELPKKVGGASPAKSRYYGYSVGHWDGNTLVIETNGLVDNTWLDQPGHPHSADMRVEERYTRTSSNILEQTVTIDDPKYYTKPWLLQDKKIFRWIAPKYAAFGTTGEYDEQFCVPSEMSEYNKAIRDAADPGSH